MSNVIQPFNLLVIALAGWLNRHQQEVIDYLMEENRVLKEQLEGQLCPAKNSCSLSQQARMVQNSNEPYGTRSRCAQVHSISNE
jgi:hypothetical protein